MYCGRQTGPSRSGGVDWKVRSAAASAGPAAGRPVGKKARRIHNHTYLNEVSCGQNTDGLAVRCTACGQADVVETLKEQFCKFFADPGTWVRFQVIPAAGREALPPRVRFVRFPRLLRGIGSNNDVLDVIVVY